MDSIKTLRLHVEQLKGRRSQIKEQISAAKVRIKENKRSLKRHEEAREVLRLVGLRTQQQLQIHISDITTLALEAVYDNPYSLVAEFVQRRNKVECDITFERNGSKIDPLNASGGGAVNIASLALRIASWSLQRPRLRNTIVLDEPLGNLSSDLMPRASSMLRQMSQKLNLQIIIVTHSDDLIETADRIFRVSIKNGLSKVVSA